MKKNSNVNLIKYTCSFSAAVLLAVSYICAKDFMSQELVEKYRILCDAFTLPGVFLTLAGAMVWVSNMGALDGISYCIRFAIFSLIPGKRWQKDEKYGEYVERRRGKRVTGYGFLTITGLVTMAIAGVFMALFYSLYNQA